MRVSVSVGVNKGISVGVIVSVGVSVRTYSPPSLSLTLTSFSVAGALNTFTASTGKNSCLSTINKLLAIKGQVIIFNGLANKTSWKVKSRTVAEHSLWSSRRRTPVNRVHISSNTVWPSLCER